MKFWIYLKKELFDLQPDFEKIFGVNNLYRDYENVWEWLESADNNESIYLNISRPHNWDTGDYDKPILIRVESNTEEKPDERTIAMLIKKQFGCDVFAGDISIGSNREPVIQEERKY